MVTVIEKEGRSPYGAIELIICDNDGLFLEAECNKSCMNIKFNFDAISCGMAKQIRPPASVLIVAISEELIC